MVFELPPPAISSSPPPSLPHTSRSHLGPRCRGPVTPVPRWKLYENPFYENQNASSAANDPHHPSCQRTVSARKLAASLWELQELSHFSRNLTQEAAFLTTFSTEASPCSHLQQRVSPTSASASPHDMNYSSMHLLLSLKEDVSWKTKESASKAPPTKEISEVISDSQGHQSTAANGHSVVDEVKHSVPSIGNFEMQEAGNRPPPHDCFRMINRLITLENEQAASVSLISTLRVELEHAHARVKELEFAQQSSRKEFDSLLRKMEDESNKVRGKEEERVKAVISSLREEVEEEKKARRKLENLNRRLAKDLSESSRALAMAVDGIERERKARVLMEDVCDELAKEIGRDKAEVEHLKREHAKVREELDEERSMLQMAEAWREERVKMKLAEARLELEERNLALNKLKIELEAFLNSRRTSSDWKDDPDAEGELREAEILREAVHRLHPGAAFDISLSETEPDGPNSMRRYPSLEPTSDCAGAMPALNHSRRWGSKQHGSTSYGLDRGGARELCNGGGSSTDEETQREGSSEAQVGSEREYSRGSEVGDQTDASDWGGNCDEGGDDDGDGGGSSPCRNSMTEEEDGGEEEAQISSDFSQGLCYRKRDSPVGVNGNQTLAIHTDSIRHWSSSSGVRSGSSRSQQASPHGGSPNSSTTTTRPNVCRINSLEAKLLEARMEAAQSSRPRHRSRFRFPK